jgi:hypothetical protein
VKASYSKFSPEEDYDLVVFGLPRSGNTYFSYNLRFAFPKLKVGSHVHNFNNLDSIKNPTAVAVIIRNPRDVVPSWIDLLFAETNLKDLELKNHLISRIKWLNTNFKILNSKKFTDLDKKVIIDFDSFTNDLNSVNSEIQKKFSLDKPSHVDQQVLRDYVKLQDKLNLGDKYQLMSHVPRDRAEINPELESLKSEIFSLTEVADALDEMGHTYLNLKNSENFYSL